MGVRWQARVIGPVVLVALALGVGATPRFRPRPVLDFGPLDLRPGATRTVTFRAGYSEPHAIGVQMDHRTAMRLFPCVADVAWRSQHRTQCEQAGAWPLALALSMSTRGADISRGITVSKADAGGQYDGEGRYTWQAASIALQRGADYALTVRTQTDASQLSAARPRLVVEVAGAGFLDSLALETLATLFAALGLFIAAVVWFVVGGAEARRARDVTT